MSEGQTAALWAGLLAVPAALALSLHLAPPGPWAPRPWQALAFLSYFLAASLLAGLDVARQVLHPRLPIRPAFVRVPLRLPHGAPRLLLAAVLGLLPGSVCVTLEADGLLLHQLNAGQDAAALVRDLERRIAALLGLSLEAGTHAG